ncbi:serine/threonine protein phosphatase PP2A-associated protein [Ramaria rubella]|nr:serine/threonine protein phosphatase PP2A-associated protein [Ramaria rubella]
MSSSSTNIPIRSLFSRALQSASKAMNLATMNDGTQDLIVSSLRDLEILSKGIDVSGMFSPNESLEDLATRHLPYLLVEYVAAEMEGRLRTVDRGERLKRLGNSQRHLHSFLHRVRQYEIIPEEEQMIHSKKASGIKDAAKRRDLKIKQYKAEKELHASLEAFRKRRGQSLPTSDPTNDFGLVAAMLPVFNSSNEKQYDDDDDDDDLRHTYLAITRLMWLQAQSQLESMEQEQELLRNAPLLEPDLPRPRVDDGNATWRLDPSVPRGGPDGKGPLLDSSGRPLRPFTILPGNTSSERSRMQAEVFRPDHRLPTMTMDDYLEEERRRGNIITGGGPQSQNTPTHSEQLTLDSEMDGTMESELKAEEKREEDERWAQYIDMHPKGEGNTMNRG